MMPMKKNMMPEMQGKPASFGEALKQSGFTVPADKRKMPAKATRKKKRGKAKKGGC